MMVMDARCGVANTLECHVLIGHKPTQTVCGVVSLQHGLQVMRVARTYMATLIQFRVKYPWFLRLET